METKEEEVNEMSTRRSLNKRVDSFVNSVVKTVKCSVCGLELKSRLHKRGDKHAKDGGEFIEK